MAKIAFGNVYYEKDVMNYTLGRELLKKYSNIPQKVIENHNNIPEMRAKENSEFGRMKSNLIIGVRKTHKYVPNEKISDFLVPYTSSGCSAMCLYCYLVCNYNKCAYLRVFVNREQMLERLIKHSHSSEKENTYEIGSNSDLVLENLITGNLQWTIEGFARDGRGKITFPTKFSEVESLTNLRHEGKTIFRMSVNPEVIIRTYELGTSPLKKRIEAVNLMCDAGYPVCILIAPVIFVENWEQQYSELITILSQNLSQKAKDQLVIEIIFMTYSFVHRAINAEAFPNTPELFNPEKMTGRGMGKYSYRPEFRARGEEFFIKELNQKLGEAKIAYIC
jgi:spore photoproduct lyase